MLDLGRMRFRLAVLLTVVAFQFLTVVGAHADVTVWVLTRGGERLEGTVESKSLSISVAGKSRTVALKDILSLNLAAGTIGSETERTYRGIEAVQGNDRRARDAAIQALTEIGLPVLTPLLKQYKDTDLHEPNPLYRLFARIVPGEADGLDRNLDIVRLANGQILRGAISNFDLSLLSEGERKPLQMTLIRTVAVRRRVIERAVTVESLRHCTQIEFLDTGIGLSGSSELTCEASGFVRLSFDIDGWSSDPDGLKVPGPNYKTNLVDGFPFGALVARINATGERWLVGKHCQKTGLSAGRLQLAVNDNPHWQNNIGSFKVRIKVTEAYNLGDPI